MSDLAQSPLSGYPKDLGKVKAEFAAHDRKAIIHCHLHKTGGSTMNRTMMANFEADAIRVATPAEVGEFRQKLANNELSEAKTYYVWGHKAHVIADELAEVMPSFRFAMIRRPLSLFESHFSFRHTRHGETELTTDAFIDKYTKNKMISFFGYKTFDEAIGPMLEKFDYIGIKENIGESISLMTYLLDLKPQEYKSRNITPPTNYVEIDMAVTDKFAKKHIEDMKFYEVCATLHDKMMRDLARLGVQTKAKVAKDATSFNSTVKTNEDIDNNKNKVSLFLTGKDLVKKDPERALEFFSKSFDVDWNMSDRIAKLLLKRDEKMFERWRAEQIAKLETRNDDQSKKMIKRLENIVEKVSA